MDCVLQNSSGCSSGCESGWTMYFNNSSLSPYQSEKRNGILDYEKRKRNKEANEEEEEEEEDLSMVSDASSGPPHYYVEVDEEEMHMNSNNSHAPIDLKKNGKMKKKKETHSQKISSEHHSLLDDTASSPVFNLSNNNFTVSSDYASPENLLEISQGYSTTLFQKRSGHYNYEYQSYYDFCHSSVSGNILQQNQLYQERRWL